jgi:anti-sigma factor RsiW
VITASEHLHPGQIDAFADRELPPDQARAVQQHIAACHPCSLRLLATISLKQSTAAAGHRFDPSPAMLARLTAQLQQNTAAKPQPKRLLSFPRTSFLWPAIAAALLLVAVSLTTWTVRRSHNAVSAELATELATELLDQHLATLSAAAAPEVLSTDRHTVKPWFEGKLPFSFNLPEATALPPGTTLKGADLTFVGDHPAALLLFTAGKHQVSVFVLDRNSLAFAPDASTRSGFALRSTAAGELRLIAVSDLDPPQLDRLLASLASAQQPR